MLQMAQTVGWPAFLATLLSSADTWQAALGVHIAETFLGSVPEECTTCFHREGVTYGLQVLAGARVDTTALELDNAPERCGEVEMLSTATGESTDGSVEGSTISKQEAKLKLWVAAHSRALLERLSVVAAPVSSRIDDCAAALRGGHRLPWAVVAENLAAASTFEVIHCEFFRALLRFLLPNGAQPEVGLRHALMGDFRDFFTPRAAHVGELVGTDALSVLVGHLGGALDRLEALPEFGNRLGDSIVKLLTQPLKLRFKRDAVTGAGLRDLPDTLFFVEPLATTLAVEDFLWARVRGPLDKKCEVVVDMAGGVWLSARVLRVHGSGSVDVQPYGDQRVRPAECADSSSSPGVERYVAPSRLIRMESAASSRTLLRAGCRVLVRESEAPQWREGRVLGVSGAGDDVVLDILMESGAQQPAVPVSRVLPLEDLPEPSDGNGPQHDSSGQEGQRESGDAGGVGCSREGDSGGSEGSHTSAGDGTADDVESLEEDSGDDVGQDIVEEEDDEDDAVSRVRNEVTRLDASSAAGHGRGGSGSMDGDGSVGSGGRDCLAAHHLQFVFNDVPLEYRPHVTVLEAIRKCWADHLREDYRKIWKQSYTVAYGRFNCCGTHDVCDSHAPLDWDGLLRPRCLGAAGVSQDESVFDAGLDEALKFELEFKSLGVNADALVVLQVLKLLELVFDRFAISSESAARARSLLAELSASTVAMRLFRQLEDPVIVCLGGPPGIYRELAVKCPFLFPLRCRKLLFEVLSLGASRSLQKLDQRLVSPDFRVAKLAHKKVCVPRAALLESAVRVLSMFGDSRAVLDVEYEDEPGTGLGPTLEFYAEVSQSIQRRELQLWWDSDTMAPGEFVRTAHGLFPRPLPQHFHAADGTRSYETIEWFRFLGKFVARALYDGRLLDVWFSQAFLKIVCGRKLTFHDIRIVSPSTFTFLERLQRICLAKNRRGLQSTAAGAGSAAAVREEGVVPSDLLFDGRQLEDLCVAFTVPGYESVELTKNGRDVRLSLENVECYLDAAIAAILGWGIRRQVGAFVDGLSTVFRAENLFLFYPEELDEHLRGSEPHIRGEALRKCLRCDHGYSLGSRAVGFFIEIVDEMSVDEQRDFLVFVTGCPRLPVRGLSELDPPLTVVRKDVSPPDMYLPSVSTCTNYIKLPDYSSKAIMSMRLRVAVREGRNAFLLS